jgi:MFS family permease
MNGLVFASWISRIPAVRDDLQLTSSALGLVLLAMSTGAVLALPLSGAVVVRLGAAGTVRVASVIAVVGLALAGLAPSVAVLVGGSVPHGSRVGQLGRRDERRGRRGRAAARPRGDAALPRRVLGGHRWSGRWSARG